MGRGIDLVCYNDSTEKHSLKGQFALNGDVFPRPFYVYQSNEESLHLNSRVSNDTEDERLEGPDLWGFLVWRGFDRDFSRNRCDGDVGEVICSGANEQGTN